MKLAQTDLDATMEKLHKYGRLHAHGVMYKELVPDSVVSGEEIVIAMYIAGKITRIVEGIAHGEMPSVDSWDDIACYAFMARWVRLNGSWP